VSSFSFFFLFFLGTVTRYAKEKCVVAEFDKLEKECASFFCISCPVEIHSPPPLLFLCLFFVCSLCRERRCSSFLILSLNFYSHGILARFFYLKREGGKPRANAHNAVAMCKVLNYFCIFSPPSPCLLLLFSFGAGAGPFSLVASALFSL
jgi:hypothetical protein